MLITFYFQRAFSWFVEISLTIIVKNGMTIHSHIDEIQIAVN